LIKDPQVLKQIFPQVLEENKKFRKYLRNFSSAQIDPQVQRIYAEVSADIDCTQCGNCCKKLEPGLTHDEARELAACKGMKHEDFLAAHVLQENDELAYLKAKPCFFLSQNKCSIYLQRPASCADYPHLNKANFKYNRNVWINAEICPIVYNVLERLKIELVF
jgi:Fe-S-cluster containining protein